jgi:hypothetical protein
MEQDASNNAQMDSMKVRTASALVAIPPARLADNKLSAHHAQTPKF